MKFLIVTFAPTLKMNNSYYSYAPYVNEINLWAKKVTKLGIISPVEYNQKLLLAPFTSKPKLYPIKPISFTTFFNALKSIFRIPKILIQIYKAMQWADHIHVRCPGNIGLLGCFVQIVFPNKPKTVKYAGNWDPNSKQPLSYKLQKWILSNTFLTKNCKVLVYGEWPNQTKNIVPFFTATYSKQEIEAKRHSEHSEVISSKEQITSSHTPRNDETKRHSEHSEAISSKEQIASSLTPRNDETKGYSQPNLISQTAALKFIYVGGLTSGKQPLLSVKVIHQLKEKGYNVHLDIYGDGEERKKLEAYIEKHQLQKHVVLNGNKSKELIKKAYQEAHFLLFVSKSEGWPKVVAEAMFWGCLPITSRVSCTPYMLGNGSRGAIVNFNCEEIVQVIQNYLTNGQLYKSQVQSAMQWSRQFTLEKFEEEIGKLL